MGRQRIIILLPGPPWELEPLFRDEFEPRLRTVLPEAFLATKEIKVAMMGESAADLKAATAMTPSQQDEMARGMVARLAARLEQNPRDADRWIMLMRAGEMPRVLGGLE